MYRYLVLLRTRERSAGSESAGEALRSAGLVRVDTRSSHALYVSDDTPLVRLSPAATVVGDLFWRDGNARVTGSFPFEATPSSRLAAQVLRECWGEYVLIQDESEDRLSVMRDPSGGAGCVYSSEGAFLTSDISLATQAGLYDKQIDWDFIRDTLVYPHLKTGRTGLSGVSELLPGNKLNISGRRLSTEEVWTPWEFVSPARRHRAHHDAQTEVRSIVASTVKTWAEADGSLLLELSGGLDSSIVAACLLEANAEVTCCNLMTPVPGADERHYARLVSELLGKELHVRTLRMEDATFEFQPPPHAVAPSTWFLQHASNALKEAIGRQVGARSYFSGGGGDTVFCYTKTAAPAADAFKERGIVAACKAIRNLAELHQCTVWKAGSLTAKKLLGPPKPPRRPEHSFVTGTPTLDVSTLHPWFAAPRHTLPGDRERIFDLAGNQVFRDGIARGVQRRLRMPLLSQPIVEACLRVPSWMWISEGRNRAVARNAFADLLPPDVFHRRSKGTFMNYSGAVYRRNRLRLKSYLLDGQLEGQGLLDTGALGRFFEQDLDSRGDSFMRIFDLCEAENWVRHHI